MKTQSKWNAEREAGGDRPESEHRPLSVYADTENRHVAPDTKKRSTFLDADRENRPVAPDTDNRPLSLHPAGLVYSAESGKSGRFVLFRHAVIRGQSDMEILTPSDLYLKAAFLSEEQCEFCQKDGVWFFRNLSANGTTRVDQRPVGEGESVRLADESVIRVSAGETFTAVFYERYENTREIDILNTSGSIEKTGDDTAGLFPQNSTDAAERISIRIDERSARSGLKKTILLKDISLSVTPGRMILILGGSGVGKSTFVHAFTGYEKARASVREGSIDYYNGGERIRHRIGFVPQEALLRDEDTVSGTMQSAADIRLPADISKEERNLRIRRTLAAFGLLGKEKETVGKLSGGEKKRLSICTEFISSPSVFVLDEPDSGLDGSMAVDLMENLLLQTCLGHTVLVITHSPDRVAELFDEVIVLAKTGEDKSGQLVFYGGIQEARAFFGEYSLEEIVRLLNTKEEGGEGKADAFIAAFREIRKDTAQENRRSEGERSVRQEAAALSQHADIEKENTGNRSDQSGKENDHAGNGSIRRGKEDACTRNGSIAPGGENIRYRNVLQQIPVCLKRQFRLMMAERRWKLLVVSVVISWLVFYVLGENMFRSMEKCRLSTLALTCICIWNGMFNTIQIVCRERKIIKREHRAGMHIASYIGAHMLYQALQCLTQVVLTLLVLVLCGVEMPDTGLMTGSVLLDLGISMFLITYCADMLGLMVSCVVHRPATAMTLMPFLLLIQLIFSGASFPLIRTGAKAISHLTVSSWGMNAVNIAVDYNSKESVLVYQTLYAIDLDRENTSELVQDLRDLLEEKNIREMITTYSASRQQIESFSYNKKNMGKCWGILFLYALLYAGAGTLILGRIDRDRK